MRTDFAVLTVDLAGSHSMSMRFPLPSTGRMSVSSASAKYSLRTYHDIGKAVPSDRIAAPI